jgi:hypothetical protein
MSEQKPENLETPSPREKVEQMQAAFDIDIIRTIEEVRVWNDRLVAAYSEDRKTGDETHLQLALQAKNELDEQWSYYGDWIMVSGVWDINRPTISSEGILNHLSVDEPVFSPAMSNGFEVEVREAQPPVVGFSFKVGTSQIIDKHLYGKIDSLAFATHNKAAFSLARKSAELESPKEQLVDAVHYYDGLLKLYTHQPSDFYRKPAKVQQRFFQKIIDDLSETITIPSYATLCQYAEVPYVYRRGKDIGPDGELSLEYITDDTNIILSGLVRGVTILDTLYATDKPLLGKDDLIDPDAGICFIVAPHEGSLHDSQVDERDLIVPARLIKQLDIVIK